jgi:hypothetical protein
MMVSPPQKINVFFTAIGRAARWSPFSLFVPHSLGGSPLVSMTDFGIAFLSFLSLSLFVLFHLSSREIPWTRLILSW